jgi:hypothetical protein
MQLLLENAATLKHAPQNVKVTHVGKTMAAMEHALQLTNTPLESAEIQ